MTHVIAPKLTETLWKSEVRNRVLLLEGESSIERGQPWTRSPFLQGLGGSTYTALKKREASCVELPNTTFNRA